MFSICCIPFRHAPLFIVSSAIILTSMSLFSLIETSGCCESVQSKEQGGGI